MIAVTRDVSRAIADAELTHLDRVPIDYERARAQHREFRRALAAAGCDVIELPAGDGLPDCVFIEDTAVVLDDVAVVTRPGAESRRAETAAVAELLAKHRPLVRIEAPATIDGGDVLVLGGRIFAGLSSRTNDAALGQLRDRTGREVVPVRVGGALHLKTAVTPVSGDTLLVNREWVDVAPFAGWNLIDVDPDEPFAANALYVNGSVIYPRDFPRTRARLEKTLGVPLVAVDAGELAKAEGGVTCCCLLIG